MTYKNMALLYDQLMIDAPYDKWITFTEEVIQTYKYNSKKIIDLGCGTGEITIQLAKKGYQLFGVDYSSEMLALAEQKAFKDSLPIQWFKQDLRNLHGFQDLDMAISFCDVFNYITTEQELLKAFSHIVHLLVDDGVFIFDVHYLNYVQERLLHNTFAEVQDDLAYIWECLPGDHEGDMYHQLTFFSLENGYYERFDEDHYQRTYSMDTYKKLLLQAGFKEVKIFGDYTLESLNKYENSERVFFIAMK